MASTRSVVAPGIFAEDALTTIPSTPIAGVPYRDPVNGVSDIAQGWPYAQRVDSSHYNQVMFQLSSVVALADKMGVLGWTNLIDYDAPAVVLGSNGRLYRALQASGPASTVRDPVTAGNETYWATVADAPNSSQYSMTTNGFYMYTDGSGRIDQWGSGTCPASGISVSQVAVTFPVPFPNAARVVTLNARDTANSVNGFYPSAAAIGIGPTQFTATLDTLSPSNVFDKTVLFSWFATGH